MLKVRIISTENNHQCEVDNGGCSYKCETDSSGIGNCICQAGYRVNRSGTCRGIIYIYLHIY